MLKPVADNQIIHFQHHVVAGNLVENLLGDFYFRRLVFHKGYPQALMANEVQVQLNGTKKRCDTVLYRRDLTARMIVEYKANIIARKSRMVYDAMR